MTDNHMYQVSVIIPVYNAQRTIRKCVESLYCGCPVDIQIILVDDCSKDESWKECLSLQNEYEHVKAVRNEVNRGVSFTRNHGLEYANSEYVLFVDSDDWVSSQYVPQMLDMAQKNRNALPICGYTLIDYFQKNRYVYVFDQKKPSDAVEQVTNLFELEKRVLLLQLWNKIFKLDLIRKHGLRFNETISMGEDFQFVLDYIEAAQIHTYMVLNRTLYYYTRVNQSSLMSKWLDTPFCERIKPYQEMVRLMGNTEESKKEYDLLVERLKGSLQYHTLKSHSMGWVQKKNEIEQFIQSVDDRKRTFGVVKGVIKEKIYDRLLWLKRVPRRLKAKIIREYVNPRINAGRRKKLTASDFTLICQNCIGGVFYHTMEKQFLSPTINLFFQEPDFMRFVSNLEYYLSRELRMQWEEEYPIGYLDDVRIDFMHYDSCHEAKAAWERRKKRIQRERIVVIATDRNGFDDECYEQWKKLPYKKVLYTANAKYASEKSSVFFPEYADQGYVGNVIERGAFYKNHVIIDVVNSLDSCLANND